MLEFSRHSSLPDISKCSKLVGWNSFLPRTNHGRAAVLSKIRERSVYLMQRLLSVNSILNQILYHTLGFDFQRSGVDIHSVFCKISGIDFLIFAILVVS
jgi:hypothetical protein